MENQDIAETDFDNFNYQLLGRMVRDCEYFLGFGGRNVKHLFYGSVEEQIMGMRKLHNDFAESQKPLWLTMEQIDIYAEKMGLTDSAPIVNFN